MIDTKSLDILLRLSAMIDEYIQGKTLRWLARFSCSVVCTPQRRWEIKSTNRITIGALD